MLTTEATTAEAPSAAPPRYFINDVQARLFLTSFTVLFFELICIRWIPAHIRYIGYFSNFILLASFLGIGLGILSAVASVAGCRRFRLMLAVPRHLCRAQQDRSATQLHPGAVLRRGREPSRRASTTSCCRSCSCS